MSEIKKLWTTYVHNEKNVLEFQEEDPNALKELIENMSKNFSSQKVVSFSKILDILEIFISKLGIPFILILNEIPLLKSLLEFINNTDRKLSQFETKTLFNIWRPFYFRFKDLLKKIPEIPEISQLIDLDLYLKDQISKEYEKSKEQPCQPLTQYDKIFLSLFEKNIKAQKTLEKFPTSEILYELLESFTAIKTDEFYSEDFTDLERTLLLDQAKKSENLKFSIKSFDPSLHMRLYKPEKTLHNSEYYVEGTEFPMKNDLTTQFMDNDNCFFEENQFPMRKLVCGFLNAKGGRIYIGLYNNKIVGIPLTKKQQDNLRLQIDETVRGFSPSVQAEELKTHFYPVVNKINKYLDRCVVKIVIKPNFKEIYFTPKPDPLVFVRQEDGKEMLDMQNWQKLYTKRMEDKEDDAPKYNDPLPLESNEIESLPMKNQNSSNKKPIYSYQYFDPRIEKEQKFMNKHLYENSSEKEIIKINNDKNKLNDGKNTEKKLKEILNVRDSSEKKKPLNKKRDNENILYNVLFVKYDKNVNEKSFFESTMVISDYLYHSVFNGKQAKMQIRRKDKKYFFIEGENDIDDEHLDNLKEICANGEFKDLQLSFAQKDIYKKQKGLVIIK